MVNSWTGKIKVNKEEIFKLLEVKSQSIMIPNSVKKTPLDLVRQ